ncbi:MAG: hypothetical protein ACRDGM_18035 [bacterium]
MPDGVILHGTRSGQDFNTTREMLATLNFVAGGAVGLGWNITVADNWVCEHIDSERWGWNARESSNHHLAVEFAQAKLGTPISDEQIEAFCWYFVHVMRKSWPGLPAVFPNHSDLPPGIRDGKTDVEPKGQHAVRDRIVAKLTAAGAM